MRRRSIAVFVVGGLWGGVAGLDAATTQTDGQATFAQCAACHSTDGSNGLGPTLKGILGRASAAVPGFSYSNAMKRTHWNWTAEELDKYIANPQGAVPGNTMPYAGMADSAQRAVLIAYLETLK
jgi:cytochrome c